MPRTNFIQNDFLAGEISPRIEMRDDIEGRKHGVAYLENWLVTIQGTLITLRGSEWVVNIPGTYGRIFCFPISRFTGFAVVVTDEKVTVLDREGYARSDSLISNGDFENEGTGWSSASNGSASVIFVTGAAVITGGVVALQVATLWQETTVIIGHKHSVTIQIAVGEGPMTVRIGSVEHGSDIATGVSSSSASIVLEDLISTTTSMWVELEVIGGAGTSKVINDIQAYDTDIAPALIEFTSPWTDRGDITFIQAVMNPKELSLGFVSPGTHPQELIYDQGTSTWTLQDMPFVSPPAVWAAGNYPATITYFGGRRWLGGTSQEPNVFWGSKSDLYLDYTLGDLPADAIEHNLDRRGRIAWMMGSKSLLIGTENAEHIVTSEGGVIIPGDIKAKVQSTFGSSQLLPVEVGDGIVYVSADGRKMRSISYEWASNAWQSLDLTYASEHITANGNNIVELNYAPNPLNLITGTTRVGTTIACTYEPTTKTAGFSRRTTPNGLIQSICSLPFAGVNELWGVFNRNGGSEEISIEKQNQDRNTKLDSHSHFESETPISVVYVPHLAGQTCGVLVDNAVHPDVIPAAVTGEVTLEFSGLSVEVGLPFNSIIVTLPLASYIKGMGTTRSTKKHLFRIFAKIIESWRPKIQGQRTPNRRVPTPMGEVEPARTETFSVGDTGWDEEAQITIIQDLPLPTELAGIFGRVDQEEI